jgi:hypothetical protein
MEHGSPRPCFLLISISFVARNGRVGTIRPRLWSRAHLDKDSPTENSAAKVRYTALARAFADLALAKHCRAALDRTAGAAVPTRTQVPVASISQTR